MFRIRVTMPAWSKPIRNGFARHRSTGASIAGALVFGALAVTAPSVHAEEATSSAASAAPPLPVAARHANNALYLELGGAGFGASVNYERTVRDVVSFRVGAGFAPIGGLTFTLPVTASYHGVGTLAHSLELGLGATLISYEPQGLGRIALFGGLLFAGYRYQPPDGGFFFRGGVDLHLEEGAFDSLPVLPWPYWAFGWAL